MKAVGAKYRAFMGKRSSHEVRQNLCSIASRHAAEMDYDEQWEATAENTTGGFTK